MNFTAFLVTFVTILPAELPDKTFVATLVLATRYRGLIVWLSVALAFAIQSLVAVAAGQVITLLPETPVLLVAGALFALGSFVMFRTAARHHGPDTLTEEIEEEEAEIAVRSQTGRQAFFVSFGVLFAAEWGDLSQLATAALSARFNAPIEVFLGSWLALVLVAGLAVIFGRWLTSHLHPAVIQRVSGGLLAILAVVSVVEAFRR